jgi:hypothetical protein
MMKVIKLNRRYVLAQYGFTHALRFNKEGRESDAIKRALSDMYSGISPWNIWWQSLHQEAPWGYYKQPRRDRPTYWIGVKNEADLTAAILKAQMASI